MDEWYSKNELLKHYDEQVIRERERFIKEIEEKCKNKGINKTAKPTGHRSFEREFRNHEKSEREIIGNRNEILGACKKNATLFSIR